MSVSYRRDVRRATRFAIHPHPRRISRCLPLYLLVGSIWVISLIVELPALSNWTERVQITELAIGQAASRGSDMGMNSLRPELESAKVAALSMANETIGNSEHIVLGSLETNNRIVRSMDKIKNLSSIDYRACCGLGHRLARQANAYYVSKKLNYAIRAFWGLCNRTEVFHYLFGPQPVKQLWNVVDTGRVVKLSNNVPGFKSLNRAGGGKQCPCHWGKIDADVEFYSDLRDRFHGNSRVEAFRQEHFQNKTVIGMHIRIGNGEKGHFNQTGRGISDADTWLLRLVEQLLLVSDGWPNRLLFLATDTESVIGKLQSMLAGKIAVVSLNQTRAKEGEGVIFGQHGSAKPSGQVCLNGWMDTVTDMVLLSYADVVVAARPSSFTSTMPMALVLATDKAARKVDKPFCEVDPEASEMRCFSDIKDWCCNGQKIFVKHSEFVQLSDWNSTKVGVVASQRTGNCIPRLRCLPYNWADYRIEENGTVTELRIVGRTIGQITTIEENETVTVVRR